MRLASYRTLSEYLEVPVGTLYAWVHEGRVPHMRISGRTVRFDLDQIDAWLAERRAGPDTGAPTHGAKRGR